MPTYNHLARDFSTIIIKDNDKLFLLPNCVGYTEDRNSLSLSLALPVRDMADFIIDWTTRPPFDEVHIHRTEVSKNDDGTVSRKTIMMTSHQPLSCLGYKIIGGYDTGMSINESDRIPTILQIKFETRVTLVKQ